MESQELRNKESSNDLSGLIFGRLTVDNYSHSNPRKDKKGTTRYWKCSCECGRKVIVAGQDLKSGHTKSCGCLRRETARKNGLQYSTKHGYSVVNKNGKRPRLYNIWNSLLDRCRNTMNKDFKRYGGRGISFDKMWINFEAFNDDMGTSYKKHSEEFGEKNTQIERIDNSKGYNKGNCKWVTPREQASNRRNNHFVTLRGKTQTLAQWSRETHIPSHRIRRRLLAGWPIDKALETSIIYK